MHIKSNVERIKINSKKNRMLCYIKIFLRVKIFEKILKFSVILQGIFIYAYFYAHKIECSYIFRSNCISKGLRKRTVIYQKNNLKLLFTSFYQLYRFLKEVVQKLFFKNLVN